MFTQVELMDAINELEGGKHSMQNCERLAAIYTVLDHLYADEKPAVQAVAPEREVETVIGSYGNSQFLQSIAGRPAREVWKLVNELVEAISVLNPRLMSSFLDKLDEL